MLRNLMTGKTNSLWRGKVKRFYNKNLEELDEQLQKFRLNLDIYLIGNPEWKQMYITEANDSTLDFEVYNKKKKNIKRGFFKWKK